MANSAASLSQKRKQEDDDTTSLKKSKDALDGVEKNHDGENNSKLEEGRKKVLEKDGLTNLVSGESNGSLKTKISSSKPKSPMKDFGEEDESGAAAAVAAATAQSLRSQSVKTRPIAERIEWLFALADAHTTEYAGPEAWLARKRYHAEHPTAILVLKCMDGRINIPVATNTPAGIIQPFRNLGGMFNLGWPHLGETLVEAVGRCVAQGRQALVVITYHFSKGSPHRGCAGFGYDTAAARRHTFQIRQQVEHVFGAGHATVFPLVCGFETDEDALILHADTDLDGGGPLLDLSALLDENDERGALDALGARLAGHLPRMPAGMRADLLPLLRGNVAHIAAVRRASRAAARPLDVEHCEWIMCLGRGFDWLHVPNVALIIGPYSPDLADPIRKAASIIQSNMREGRIPDDGFLVLSSAPYHDIGVDRARAILKAGFMRDFAADVIRKEFPELATKMNLRTTVLSWESRTVEHLD
eukprot:CAMPEP_0172188144 /NCGR_PEP_ID=MMETSP1050-20130122/21743_1 /TAXON_ID=233186 /ORGANISM="Cryptomonas curvata, Strain CCAP979/52" /LENGTH=472 /DNA_ID=CAMNT_0012862571 /DNA_START=15 /DNA_END=1433 /DNA_ORIENTATION=-